MPKISVILPCYNEEKTVAAVMAEHIKVLQDLNLNWQIVCLDDASTDNSLRAMEAMAKQFPQIKLIRHPVNKGIFAAYDRLFHEAEGDFIFLTASDGQWPGENLRILWNHLAETASDLVIGVRTNRHEIYSFWRQILSSGFNLLSRALGSEDTKDANGIKLGRRELFVMPLKSRSYFVEVERILEAKKKGYKVTYQPILFLPRNSGKAKGAKWSSILAALRDFFRYSFSFK